MTCRKVPWRRRNQERVSLLGQGWEVPDDGPTGVRHEGGVTVILASMRNVRTCRSDVKGAGQAGSPCKTLSTKAEHRGGVARSSEEGSVMGLERRGGLVQWDGDGQPVIGRNYRDLTTGSRVCPGREEPYETRVCAVQNGELNPCCRQEKLKEVLLGHQPYRMAKALWDHSMVEKHEASEHARLVVVQDPRDTVKAGLPESQSPGMEAHIHRHGMYGRCPWNRTVSLSSSELFLQGTTVSEIVQGDEQDTYVALGRSTRTDTGSPKHYSCATQFGSKYGYTILFRSAVRAFS